MQTPHERRHFEFLSGSEKKLDRLGLFARSVCIFIYTHYTHAYYVVDNIYIHMYMYTYLTSMHTLVQRLGKIQIDRSKKSLYIVPYLCCLRVWSRRLLLVAEMAVQQQNPVTKEVFADCLQHVGG